MLNTSDRVSPCRARLWRSSLGRSTSSVESSWRTLISPGRARSSDPCGPLTAIRPSDSDTSTPAGTGIGDLPIRLTSTSPHVTEDFAADLLAGRLAIGHQPGARGQDGDAQPPQHARQTVGCRVHTEPRLGHPPQPRDRALALRRVLHLDLQHAPRSPRLLADAEVLDVPLALEDAGERLLQL